MSELPYQAEYAKSGRASCKGCKTPIPDKTLRLAVMVQSAFYDGKQANWFHEECFFKRQRPKSVNDIGKFNTLRNEDQNRIKEAIENAFGEAVLPKPKGKGKKASKRANEDNKKEQIALRDFFVEYSKSSRATCAVCEIKIVKDEVRISKTVYDTEIGIKYGGQALWHHVKCFNEARKELMYFAGGADLPGIKKLKAEDQEMVKEIIKPLTDEEVPIKKLKEEPKDNEEVNAEKALENKIQKQNKLFFKYKDTLGDFKKKDLKELLEANSQVVPKGENEMLERVADMMAFGALEPCPECKNGQFVLEVYGYKCKGSISEWTRCTNVSQKPARRAMLVPGVFKATEPLFTTFKPTVRVRLFKAAPPPPAIVMKEEMIEKVKSDRPTPPLKNLQFFLYGKLTDREMTKRRVLKLGGAVVSDLTDTLAAVFATKQTVKKMPIKMKQIQDNEIEVVEESYLDLIDPDKGTIAKSLELIKLHNIAEWGSDPLKRVPQDVLHGKSAPKSSSAFKKSSGVTKLKIKGGTAVDPDSGLEDIAHVYKDSKGTKYTVVLAKTDVVKQKNSFYKLQILEADNKKKYWLFRSWGRTGTTIGGHKLENLSSVDKAISEFEDLYYERTENTWDCRDMFEKVPGGYYPLDVDYGDDQPDSVKLAADPACKLPMPVQEFIMRIFDIDLMKKTLLEFELDTEQMPLGKISKKQIKSAYTVLSTLLADFEKGQASQPKIIDCTNRFYTLVPHSFGIDNPPLLDVESIKKKTEMLDNLLEIEIAYSLLKTESDENTSPIQSHYIKLKTEIVPLEKGSPEFELLLRYITNTHAPTHTNYTLEPHQVFKVVRDGEKKRFKPFKKLHNRRLLWHGSRVTNFAGILSQGLRIAPPEAPVSGYMFGKGVYFADMVSKSANYCCTNAANPIGVMLLCEVALGDMLELTRAQSSIVKPPAGKHSVYGQGKSMPDPAQDHVLEDGVIVPLGKPVTRPLSTSLLYNEFIVYDVAQVQVKYLFEMKFNYNFNVTRH